MQIILHVGMPKTATTTLQVTFDQNYEHLIEKGILYPKSGRFPGNPPCHHALFLPVATSRKAVPTPFPASIDSFESLAKALEDERQATGVSSIILSSEMLWNAKAFDVPALTRIRDAFPCYEFTILAYLRPIESHALSSYAQSVVGPQRQNIPFKEYVSKQLAGETYKYDRRLDTLISVFGQSAVKPIWLPWLERDVLGPFREVLPELTTLKVINDQNISRSWLYIAMCRNLNRFEGKITRRINTAIRRKVMWIDPVLKRHTMFDAMFNPIDNTTKQTLVEKTKRLLSTLQDKYGIR